MGKKSVLSWEEILMGEGWGDQAFRGLYQRALDKYCGQTVTVDKVSGLFEDLSPKQQHRHIMSSNLRKMLFEYCKK